MSGSSFGKIFRITTWGESHGPGIGVVIDGCPAGLTLSAELIQKFLDRRRPGQSKYTTKRNEADSVEILSGVFEGKTTGTPISLLVRNQDQRSRDYGNIAELFRPGHADYPFTEKYGIRDYRGGGRSSGRETIGRVAAGAVASLLLDELGNTIHSLSYQDGKFRTLQIASTLPKDFEGVTKASAVRLSEDDGETFAWARQLKDGEFVYSAAAQMPNGEIGVLFEPDTACREIKFASFSVDWIKGKEAD